jgi:hypothetical protein
MLRLVQQSGGASAGSYYYASARLAIWLTRMVSPLRSEQLSLINVRHSVVQVRKTWNNELTGAEQVSNRKLP